MLRRCCIRARSLLALTLALSTLAAPSAELQENDARGVLDALDAYTGLWRSEAKTGVDGDPQHFEYDLRWFDSARTVAKMVIRQVSASGTTVLFEGFKGAGPEGVYYFAASPGGRAARGEVVLEGALLVTRYEGWSAAGPVVEVRDVFDVVTADGKQFISRTWLRPSPEAEWRQIGEDLWTRVSDREEAR